MLRGKYIVFEGIDGSGKTTQAKALAMRLKERYEADVIWTREPGSEFIDLKVRDLVLSDKPLTPAGLELLLQADRSEHTAWVLDKLRKGNVIISDRSFISGLAYGLANKNKLDHILSLVDFSVDVLPDHIFFMDRSVHSAFREMEQRGGEATREEKHGPRFMEQVRTNFMNLLFSPLGRDSEYDILRQLDQVCSYHRLSVDHRTIGQNSQEIDGYLGLVQ